MGFRQNVFVNCPFDDEYLPLLRPLLFCVTYLGFTPRIALESLDSGKPRFDKIVSLVRQSKYAIHDLSRLKSRTAGEYYRLNMPFELGLDVGCRLFKSGQWSGKKCLILEAERFQYQAALSDLSNSDIAAHGNQPLNVVSEVRNWLNNEANLRAPGPAEIWGRFADFMADNYEELTRRGFSDSDIERLPINELMVCIDDWIDVNL
jgi:hypothetical protein